MDSIKNLWYSGSEQEWQKAFNHYYALIQPEQLAIELQFAHICADSIRKLSAMEFYDFLHNQYFVWKYTAKNRLATTRKSLEKYIANDELAKLEEIQKQLVAVPLHQISPCLEIAAQIRGLGTAGASGLLSILYPEQFGTVDQFVVKRLQEIEHPIYQAELDAIDPMQLTIEDGELLIQIMREKAFELNRKFQSKFWTPKKLDMLLWAYGRA